MAKKQVIWSRWAKKDLYTALESHLICFFTVESWQFLFEEQEASIMIHNVSECSPEIIAENF